MVKANSNFDFNTFWEKYLNATLGDVKGKLNCCICGKPIKDYGHNPFPLKNEGRCCDECNEKVVMFRVYCINKKLNN